MTVKEWVLQRVPNARQEHHRTNRHKTYYLIPNGREFMPICDGETPAAAWKKAAQRIAEKIVRKKYPNCECVNEHEKRYSIYSATQGLIGFSSTELKAWMDAAEKTEEADQ